MQRHTIHKVAVFVTIASASSSIEKRGEILRVLLFSECTRTSPRNWAIFIFLFFLRVRCSPAHARTRHPETRWDFVCVFFCTFVNTPPKTGRCFFRPSPLHIHEHITQKWGEILLPQLFVFLRARDYISPKTLDSLSSVFDLTQKTGRDFAYATDRFSLPRAFITREYVWAGGVMPVWSFTTDGGKRDL